MFWHANWKSVANCMKRPTLYFTSIYVHGHGRVYRVFPKRVIAKAQRFLENKKIAFKYNDVMTECSLYECTGLVHGVKRVNSCQSWHMWRVVLPRSRDNNPLVGRVLLTFSGHISDDGITNTFVVVRERRRRAPLLPRVEKRVVSVGTLNNDWQGSHLRHGRGACATW